MKGKSHLRLEALCIILAVWFLLPSLPWVQAKEGSWERLSERAKIIKKLQHLKLAPEKEEALLDLDRRYAQERQEIVAALKRNQGDLQAALAAAASNEAKIKDLVGAVNASQDKLLTSFKKERDEALSFLTPVQQGQFLIIMGNWYQEMMKKP